MRHREKTKQELISELEGLRARVTHLERVNDALQLSEEKFRIIFENAIHEIVYLDRTGRIMEINKKESITGYKREELLGKHFSELDLYDSPKLIQTREIFQETLKKNTSQLKNIKIHHKDGNSIFIQTNSILVKKDGQIEGILFIIQNITERKRAEEELRFQAMLLDQSKDRITATDLEGKIIYVNRAECEGVKRSREELIGKSVEIYGDDPNIGATQKEIVETTLREGEWRGEVVNTAGDGTQSIVEVHSWVVRDPEGNAKYLCGISSDITERKRAEETLRESEQRFRAAANCSSDLIYEDNNETGQVKWYGDIDGLLGYKQGEFRATFQGWKNSLHPEDRDRVIKEIEKCTHTGEAYCVEYRIKHKNGTYRYWVDRGTVFQEEGKPRKTVGACEDITEHKRIEQALRESEVKHRTLLENLPQKIFYKDVDSVYISCNENFARDLGIKSEEFAGRTDYEFFPEKLAEKYRNDDKRIIESGKTEEIEEKYVRDGKEFIVKTLKTPVRDEEGNIAGILGVFWDITERRRIEVELEQYREKMVRAEQLAGLGAVGANLSHQLNQPLTVIQLMLENSKTRLEKTSCPEIVKENIKEGLEAVAMADRIVKCYRDLARFPDHTMFKKIDLQKIADQLALVLSKSALQSQLRLVIEDMRNLPKIIGDPGELEQIFFILIENAIQAADGKKERQLTIRAANQDGKLRLEFTDDCGGIEPENLDKIYDPFFTTKPRGQGTGLGLGIVQQILARHKGTIRVESQVGRGTTFYVTLPWIKLI